MWRRRRCGPTTWPGAGLQQDGECASALVVGCVDAKCQRCFWGGAVGCGGAGDGVGCGGAGIVLVQLGYLLLSASLPALLGVQVVQRLWLWELHLCGDDLCGGSGRAGAAQQQPHALLYGGERRAAGRQPARRHVGAACGLSCAAVGLCRAGGLRHGVFLAACGGGGICVWLDTLRPRKWICGQCRRQPATIAARRKGISMLRIGVDGNRPRSAECPFVGLASDAGRGTGQVPAVWQRKRRSGRRSVTAAGFLERSMHSWLPWIALVRRLHPGAVARKSQCVRGRGGGQGDHL
jgi:hypothetical protein